MKKHFSRLILIAVMVFTASMLRAQFEASVTITANIAPPVLPVYSQPMCPVDGYMWTPGYWAWGPDGYYWVPGVWIAPPEIGFLWTPGYWGFAGGFYGWHGGYWGPHIGFYGGVNYGYGYGGMGFVGGMWQGRAFHYNTAVVNVNTTVIHNTYVNRTVINNTVVNHTSFNGQGGITARPSPQEQAAMNERHAPPTTMQVSHQQTASHDRSQFASVNHGRPAALTMDRVGGNHFGPQGHPAQNHPTTTTSNRASLAQPEHPVNARPVSNHPITNQPPTNHPVNAHPVNNHPITNQPPTNHPVTNHPVNNHPITNQPPTNLPVTNHPVNNHPITNQPPTNHPVTNHPVTNQPAYHPESRPVTNHPANNRPVNNQPVNHPAPHAQPQHAPPPPRHEAAPHRDRR